MELTLTEFFPLEGPAGGWSTVSVHRTPAGAVLTELVPAGTVEVGTHPPER